MSQSGTIGAAGGGGGSGEITLVANTGSATSISHSLNVLGINGILTSASGNTLNITPSGSGVVVKAARLSSSAIAGTNVVLPLTGITPTTSNTSLLYTINYTPLSSSNILIFNASIPSCSHTVGSFGFFIFAGSTLLASFTFNSSGTQGFTATFSTFIVSGTTSPTNYSIYFANATNNSDFIYINSVNGSIPWYNGTSVASFTITETTP